MHTSTKGFTLVELLVVIAILAVLSVAVVLVLNPAELLNYNNHGLQRTCCERGSEFRTNVCRESKDGD